MRSGQFEVQISKMIQLRCLLMEKSLKVSHARCTCRCLQLRNRKMINTDSSPSGLASSTVVTSNCPLICMSDKRRTISCLYVECIDCNKLQVGYICKYRSICTYCKNIRSKHSQQTKERTILPCTTLHLVMKEWMRELVSPNIVRS